MAEWRVGRKLGVTLYRDEVFVGHVSSPEIAAEIVETMNRVGRLLADIELRDPPPGVIERIDAYVLGGQAPESGRERSPQPAAESPFEHPTGSACPACVDPWRWHQHGRCAGDFMYCTCTQTPPDAP